MTDEFRCPSCQSPYKVVRVEVDDKTRSAEVKCTECGFPFAAHESGHILKYFKTAPARTLRAVEH